MEEIDAKKADRIRVLNDRLRCKGVGGQVVVTAGLYALGSEKVREILDAIAAFNDFNGDNDPHGEHDCALVTVSDLRILWKIDYYDSDLAFHSPDASDQLTRRVMTVMLADEY